MSRRASIRIWGALLLYGLVFPYQVFAVSGMNSVAIQTSEGISQLNVEIASTADQRERGLMQRTSLADNSGMLFTYGGVAQSGSRGYWMYHTLIPLDIAFIGVNGTIVSAFTMPPCRSDDPSLCPIYRPGKPYIGALETSAGYFSQHHVQVGDMVGQGLDLLK